MSPQEDLASPYVLPVQLNTDISLKPPKSSTKITEGLYDMVTSEDSAVDYAEYSTLDHSGTRLAKAARVDQTHMNSRNVKPNLAGGLVDFPEMEQPLYHVLESEEHQVYSTVS